MNLYSQTCYPSSIPTDKLATLVEEEKQRSVELVLRDCFNNATCCIPFADCASIPIYGSYGHGAHLG